MADRAAEAKAAILFIFKYQSRSDEPHALKFQAKLPKYRPGAQPHPPPKHHTRAVQRRRLKEIRRQYQKHPQRKDERDQSLKL